MGHLDAVYSVALSVDGLTLVSGSRDGIIKIWDMPTGKEVRTLTGHTAPIGYADLSDDGQTLISASWDKTIKIWDMPTGKEVRTLTGHTDAVWSVALSTDGQTLVSGSDDGTIIIWGALIHLPRLHHERLRRLELALRGHLDEHRSAVGAGPFEFLGEFLHGAEAAVGVFR